MLKVIILYFAVMKWSFAVCIGWSVENAIDVFCYSSSDERALVLGARQLGFVFHTRLPERVTITVVCVLSAVRQWTYCICIYIYTVSIYIYTYCILFIYTQYIWIVLRSRWTESGFDLAWFSSLSSECLFILGLCSAIYTFKIFLVTSFRHLLVSWAGEIGRWPGWLAIVLQCYDTVGWVIWPVKLSEWDVKPYYTILSVYLTVCSWSVLFSVFSDADPAMTIFIDAADGWDFLPNLQLHSYIDRRFYINVARKLLHFVGRVLL